MKRIIALLLCFTLVFTLCSCGKEAASSAESSSTDTASTPKPEQSFHVEYKDTQVGYIIHTGEAVSHIDATEGFECMGDFYLYLPEGTEIACGNKFAVFCYNEHFTLDTEHMKSCGQKLLSFSPVFSTDTRTLKKDCYIRLSVNGKLSDVSIRIPDGKEGIVISGAKEDLLYGPQINVLQQNLRDKNNAVNYIFITDLHYDSDPTTQKSESLFKQVKAAVKIANTTDCIDFIVIGGDATSGMYSTKADALKYTAEILSPLKDCKKPVFVLTGNHDDNSYLSFHMEGFLEDQIVSDKDWSDNIIKVFCPENVVKDSKHKDSKYYYYDLEGKKTRVICLDAIDYRAKYDKNGVIKELPVKDASKTDEEEKYWSGCSYWGYSEGQIRWLVNEAMTAPDDWDYVFMSHMGIDVQTQTNYYEPHYGTVLRNVISAFQNRKNFSYEGMSANYTDVTGKVLSYNFGHTHRELTRYSKDIDLWQINTATAQVGTGVEVVGPPKVTNDSKGNDWVSYDRKYGTDNEACFDIISVTDTVIFKYAFGAGTDEILKYE